MYFKIGELIPDLHRLQDNLIPEMEEEEYRSTVFHLEMLPYSLMATQNAFHNCISTHKDILEEMEARGLDDNTTLHLSPVERERLGFPIDSFLEAARRTQNALRPYLSKTLKLSVSKSMSALVKNIETGKTDLGEVLNDIVSGYWRTHGKRLKEFRDLSQHYTVVSSDARLFRSDEGKLILYFLLPNNPEVTKPAKLIYDNPPVHAYLYVREQFIKLVGVIYSVINILAQKFPERINPDGTRTFTLRPVMARQPIVRGVGAKLEGHRLLEHEEMKKDIQRSLSHFKKVCDKGFK